MLSFKQFITEEFNKEDEARRAKNSNLQSGVHAKWDVHVTVHGGSQEQKDFEHRQNLTPRQWDKFKTHMVQTLKKKPHGHYVVYSKNRYQQGVIAQHIPDEKRIKIMTVLPKGKYAPRDSHTDVHIMESVREAYNFDIIDFVLID